MDFKLILQICVEYDLQIILTNYYEYNFNDAESKIDIYKICNCNV